MARPQKEGMDYFPHDTDASNDEKIEALRALFGNDGYAFYFILLERIYRTPSFELDISDTETIQILSRKIAVTEQQFNRMLETALKRKCFDPQIYEERRVLTSPGIKKRASVVIEKREAMRSKYKKISKAETNQETTPETPQSKEKESKEKESKEKESKEKACANEQPEEQHLRAKTQVELFERFWNTYPKKRSKGQAEKAWDKLKVDEQFLGVILAAIERAKKSTDWTKENGRYIPYPATWLNAKGWEDEPTHGPPGGGKTRNPTNDKYENFYL